MKTKLSRIFLTAFTLLLIASLVIPLIIPIPPLPNLVPAEQLADADSRFIEVEGLNVHYKTYGSGPTTLILLHGFGSSLFSWREVAEALGQEFRVIAFDRPAFGLTERPLEWSGENPYSPEFQTKLVIGLMDALEVQQAALVGNSAGGAIAMLTALRYPERIQALILVDPAVYHGGGSPDAVRWLLQTPQVKRIGPLIARRIQTWGDDLARSSWHDPSKITPEIWDGYHLPLQVQDWDQALWNLTAASRDMNLDERLAEFQLPVLVITGDDDRIVPTEESIRLESALPNAALAVIPNCGHVPHEECPQDFLSAVEEFMRPINANSGSY